MNVLDWLSTAWKLYSANREDLVPIGGALAIIAAFWKANIATRRHYMGRLTENYSKAVEKMASDKVVERLGGIYTLERISRESPSHYWAAMETLTAFVRGQARRKELEGSRRWEVPTDIATVLIVICRRDKTNRKREKKKGWQFDLRGADLRGADLRGAHLEGANLVGAYLGRANLVRAYLEGAILWGAHLEGAILWEALLEGANLVDATGLTSDQLETAHGDAKTRLPEGVPRPAHWPPEAPEQ